MTDVYHCMFCLRSDGTPYVVEDIVDQALDWLTELFPTEAPVPGVWVQVPTRLRPEGMAHAFFNAYASSKPFSRISGSRAQYEGVHIPSGPSLAVAGD
jgi:hypothetical protein